MSEPANLSGKRFGEWTVVRMERRGGDGHHSYWLCRCSCGTEASVRGDSLRNGNSTQCKSCATWSSVRYGFKRRKPGEDQDAEW